MLIGRGGLIRKCGRGGVELVPPCPECVATRPKKSATLAIIARDIDRLTERWDAESVPRAVASVAPEVGYWREPRPLPLAVLIRRGLTIQCRELKEVWAKKNYGKLFGPVSMSLPNIKGSVSISEHFWISRYRTLYW